MKNILNKVGKEAIEGMKVALFVFVLGRSLFGIFTKSEKEL